MGKCPKCGSNSVLVNEKFCVYKCKTKRYTTSGRVTQSEKCRIICLENEIANLKKKLTLLGERVELGTYYFDYY
jgi:hypothetical protein